MTSYHSALLQREVDDIVSYVRDLEGHVEDLKAEINETRRASYDSGYEDGYAAAGEDLA